jgi:prevent-host-death family protein
VGSELDSPYFDRYNDQKDSRYFDRIWHVSTSRHAGGPMPRTVSASEAKTNFGAIANWAAESKDDVIVESHGEPKVVIMSFEEYQQVLKLREEARRQSALLRLRNLRDQVRAHNQDLSEEQATSLADRFSEEVIADMADEGQAPDHGQ